MNKRESTGPFILNACQDAKQCQALAPSLGGYIWMRVLACRAFSCRDFLVTQPKIDITCDPLWKHELLDQGSDQNTFKRGNTK